MERVNTFRIHFLYLYNLQYFLEDLYGQTYIWYGGNIFASCYQKFLHLFFRDDLDVLPSDVNHSDDYSFSSDIVKETRRRLKSLEKQADVSCLDTKMCDKVTK